MTDITTIKRDLTGRVQLVAEMLLPGGRKEGNEWRAGSVSGEKGQSLGVHLSGAKAGVWADFQSGESGDLLDLWRLVKGISLSEAIAEAKSFLGIEEIEPFHKPKKEYERPPKPRCTAISDGPLDYLSEHRGIPYKILKAYRVASNGDDIIFPFLLPDGSLALAKSRRAGDGEKPKPTAANCEPVLFGWQAVPDETREIVICEGEIDALSWAAYGRSALSVPFGGGGGGKQNWIESEYDRLQRFEKIYLALDMDEPGEQAAVEISRRLGLHRCYRVTIPHKDANECLTKGVLQEVMDKCIADAKSYTPDGLRNASEYADDVISLFWPAPDHKEGYVMPYGKIGKKLYFRGGEVTLWTGGTGSGKSQILSDCCVDWMSQGSRVCLASLEMKPQISLKRMVKQAGNVERPTEGYIREIFGFLGTGLYLYGHVGKKGVDGLIEVFDFARAKYGCDQFIIDSLMRLGYATDDYNGMEGAVYKLVNWAVASDVHVHLVAHARKAGQGAGVTDGEDVKGPMELIANAANIIAVWRNRKLEEDLSKENDLDKLKELKDKPGVILNIAKQRNGDFEGKIGLWFNQETYRYRSSECRKFGREYISYSKTT